MATPTIATFQHFISFACARRRWNATRSTEYTVSRAFKRTYNAPTATIPVIGSGATVTMETTCGVTDAPETAGAATERAVTKGATVFAAGTVLE